MDTNSRREKSEEKASGDSPLKVSAQGDFDDVEEYDKEKGRERGKHRSKDSKKSRREDDHHRSRDKDRLKTNDGSKERVKEKKKDGKEEHEKDRSKDKVREKDSDRDKPRRKEHDKDRKDRDRKKDHQRELENDGVRGKERVKEKEGEKDKGRDREQEKDKDYSRKKARDVDHDKERSTDRERSSRRSRDDHGSNRDTAKNTKAELDSDYNRDKDANDQGKTSHEKKDVVDSSAAQVQPRKEIEDRILKMKEERLKRKSEGASEILSWVSKSRNLEDKIKFERRKAKQRSKILDEQDIVDDDGDVEALTDALAGVKVLHGFDKVLEGGAVVLTLKDQEILADGDLNENMDMLENVEIGEQKRRNDAYKAGKKTVGVYDDKFGDQLGEEKKMLPQYDDPAEEEGVTLDVAGRFTADGNKKLEELRRKLQIPSHNDQLEDLNSSVRISSDYYTPEEMLQFKKPKKKKSLRKREKLDIDALEAEARAEGLGASDLRARSGSKSITTKEEEEKAEAKRRSSAYQAAFAKADEASKALRMEQTRSNVMEEDDAEAFDDGAEDLEKSLERARKLALQKQTKNALSGLEAIARRATTADSSQSIDAENSTPGEALENKVVFTEMEEFVWGLQLDDDSQKRNHEDVFMEEDDSPKASDKKNDAAKITDSGTDEPSKIEVKEDIVPDDTIHEVAVGKGLSGALKLLKDRGTLKDRIEWGGRNMDKKKSKLAGIHDDEGPKEIHLERRDEFGRVLTPKEAFRLISHKFHGKGPGKGKQEKRMKQYQDEQKLKQMTSSDVLPQSVERMREAQLQNKTPYLVLSGHVKSGQTSDPRSGFAAVEKEVPGSLTPMLGDEKVERFLGIKRKAEDGSSGSAKKPKT